MLIKNKWNKIVILALLLQGGAGFAQGKISPVAITGKAADAGSGYVYLQRFDNKLFLTVDSARIEKRSIQDEYKNRTTGVVRIHA